MGAATAAAAVTAADWECREGADSFDELPDDLVLYILNLVGDARSLARCRPLCRRLDALVPQADRLLISVDAVVTSEPGGLCSLLPQLGHRLFLPFQSLLGLVSTKSAPTAPLWRSPVDLIQGFPCVRRLEIELPGGDLVLQKGEVVRWKAEFGGTLRRCAILSARSIVFGGGGGDDGGGAAADVGGGIKERVIRTIGVLISASGRHAVAMEVVRGRRSDGGNGEEVEEMEQLVVVDGDGEGTLVMGREGVRECVRDGGGSSDGAGSEDWRRGRGRTVVPAVRMRMWCAPVVEVGGGVRMEGATLVVVRAVEGGGEAEEEEEEMEVERWAAGVFQGEFRCAAAELLKRQMYSLEMNSF